MCQEHLVYAVLGWNRTTLIDIPVADYLHSQRSCQPDEQGKFTNYHPPIRIEILTTILNK